MPLKRRDARPDMRLELDITGLGEGRDEPVAAYIRLQVVPCKGHQIVVLITVVKKGNKIPAHQMDTARKRLREVQSG